MMLREGLALYRRVALASVAAAAPVVFVAAPEASTRPASPHPASKMPSTGTRMILATRLQAATAANPNPARHLDNRLLRLAPHLCPLRTSPPRRTPRVASVQRPLRVPPILLQRLALPTNTIVLPCAMAATTSPRP
jgi:hypothetical protein